jgi:hypothetical protein
MKNAFGGYAAVKTLTDSESGGCSVHIRNPDGSGYWTGNWYIVAEAQALYNSGQQYSNGAQATGYCCASC